MRAGRRGRGVEASAPAPSLGPEIQLRTYRLALITDPSYATYHGVANVTAAKVTLMNRVNQIYETESAIRMVLIADNDKLNLNTVALATGANGPCGAAALLHGDELLRRVLDRNRIVIGQIIGASNYDVGHIAMGNSGGGVANLGVVGGNNKAGGCTGLATPIGDYFAVDYVAHEMGHQFAGNHTFNGTLVNCGGNRSGQTSVEPGSGSSVMAYAGICGAGQPPAAQRPVLGPEELRGDPRARHRRPAADQRGPERLVPRLRRHRLVHAELGRQDERPDRARHELHRGRDPDRDPGRRARSRPSR